MRKLAALARAFGIVGVAVLPGFGAYFTVEGGDAHGRRARAAADALPAPSLEMIGTYEADGDGALRFHVVETRR